VILGAGSTGSVVDVWAQAERYLGVGTRTYSRFSADLDVDDAYHPQRGLASFEVPTYWIPDGTGSYLTNGLPSELHALYRADECFLLPVHPQTLAMLNNEVLGALGQHEPGPVLTVVPSANVRTVFVLRHGSEPVRPHFVKLHYPRRLSRFTRRLRRPIISVQLWVAAELARIGAPALPEVGAGVFGDDAKHAWGFLLREIALPPGRFAVPLFALYGRDIRSPDDPTLLEQLIVRSGDSPASFLTDRLVRPMVRLWVRAATQTGCALEMHGQNTLFCFDSGLGSGSDVDQSTVVYRDCGVYVDPTVRARRGLPVDDLPPINVMGRDVSFPREQVFSLAYDSFLGHHALSFVGRLGEERFGVPVEELRAAARDEFSSCPEAASLLPPTVAYYDDQLHDDGGWELVDTGAAPDWR
jgi:hypothetical protein